MISKTIAKTIKETINEEIEHSPRYLGLFVNNFIKVLDRFQVEQTGLSKQFKELSDDEQYWIGNILKWSTSHEIDLEVLGNIFSLTNKFKEESVEIKYLLEVILANAYNKQYLYYLQQRVERMLEKIKGLRTICENYDQKELEKSWQENYSEELPLNKLKLVERILESFLDMAKVLDNVSKKLALTTQGLKTYSGIQTLYHTSINADVIAKNGFDPKGPPGTEGLGGSQKDSAGNPSTSFTSDLYVAKEIMRTLREVILIANGKLTYEQIWAMAAQIGVVDEVLKTYKAINGNKLNKGNPVNVFNFYRFYLSHASQIQKRYDPVFFDTHGLIPKLKGKNEQDVGILVCSVDMNDQNILYLPSMAEYRVPVRSIKSINKVLK
jgi:hypothetical protein